MTTQEPDLLPTSVVKVSTPDGVMFVHIVERDNKPYRIDITIGKAGSSIQAWAQALSKTISLALMYGLTLEYIAEAISNITTDKLAFNGNRAVRSGPDGITQAILIYLASKKSIPAAKRQRRGPSVFGEDSE